MTLWGSQTLSRATGSF